MQQAVVAGESHSIQSVLAGAQLKHVEGGGEEEGELQGGSEGVERIGCGIVGGEDGDVEGVVLRGERGRLVSGLGR